MKIIDLKQKVFEQALVTLAEQAALAGEKAEDLVELYGELSLDDDVFCEESFPSWDEVLYQQQEHVDFYLRRTNSEHREDDANVHMQVIVLMEAGGKEGEEAYIMAVVLGILEKLDSRRRHGPRYM